MIKAVIFDMDGTVLKSLDTLSFYCNAILAAFHLPPIPTERYMVLVGDGAHTLVERMVREVGASPELVEPILTAYLAAYNADPHYLTEPYEGILPMMDALCGMGVRCAILTNKPESTACPLSERLFGDRVSLLWGGVPSRPLKPHPDLLPAMLNTLGITAEECVYVGDTRVDMQTGSDAGAYTVGVLWGFRGREELEENGADLIVSTPAEISEYVRKVNGVR